jgi:hypothetical protein
MLGRRILVFTVVAVGGAGVLAVPGATGAWAAPARGAAPAAASVWGKATGVPGLGVLNKGGSASVRSVSCTSADNCSAGGSYKIKAKDVQGFVVTERNGRWGRAAGVPGLAALNKGGQAQVLSVSCTSSGNCAAGGDYQAAAHRLGFVAVEKNGVWGQAIAVPGLVALNQAGPAAVTQVSCGSAGNCVAGGSYSDSVSHQQGFAAIEKNGVWGQAIEVPGLGALNQGVRAAVTSVSCGSGRYCAAVGYYTDGSGDGQGFLDSETNGTWGQATGVPGLAALNQGGGAEALTVSCASAGNCGVGGDYTDGVLVDGGYSNGQGFVVDEKNGVWDQAIEVPGLGALNAQFDVEAAFTGSISCTAPGDCLAAGTYGQPYSWAFVASEKNGVWGTAVPVPGLEHLVTGRYAEIGTASCASTGNCAVGGDYENMFTGDDTQQGFAGSERNGHWSNAVNMPGETALSRKPGFAEPMAVSCGATGHCTAVGFFTDGHNHTQGFVTQGS